MNFKFYTIMITIIYGIKDPHTNKIVYVGKTQDELSHYLKSKYWKLNEVKREERNWNKLFKYLDNLLPEKPTLEILFKCDSNKPFNNADGMEKLFIKKYKKINPDLLNETDGGTGGNTYKYKTIIEKTEIGFKISKKLKGKKKPEGFGEHLSKIRKGANNPMAIKQKIGMFKNNKLIKVFSYGYEINEYFNNKHAYSNIAKVLKGKISYQPMGYEWKYLK